jgi:hypothetical protein
MASNINPTNIDGSYPIAGQDNDSQGFRDNFTNIKTNLTYAKSEIDDLQSKVILKSALVGSTLSNDMNNAVLYRAQLKAVGETFRDLGTQIGIITLSFLDGNVQKVTTAGSLTLSLADFPASGTYGSMRFWVNVTNTGHHVTFPQSCTLGIGNLTNLNQTSKMYTFPAVGHYLFEISTADGGSNYWVIKLA